MTPAVPPTGRGDDELRARGRRVLHRLGDPGQAVRPGRVVDLLGELRNAGAAVLAIRVATAAHERFPQHPRVQLALAEVMLGQERPAAAVGHLRAAIAADPRPALLLLLAETLAAAQAPDEAVDLAYAEAIRGDPRAARPVMSWRQSNEARGRVGPDSAGWEASLDRLQTHTSHPLLAVLRQLFAAEDAERYRAAHARMIAAFLDSEDAQRCARVWDRLARLQPLDLADAAAVASIPTHVCELFFLCRPTRLVALDEVGPAQDVSEEAHVWWSQTFLRPDHPRPDTRDFASREAAEIARRADQHLAFQSRVVRDRRLELRDLHTAAACTPFDCLVAHGRAFYSFGDNELSVLITAGTGGKAAALLLPRLDTAVDLGAQLGRLLTAGHLAAVQARLLRRASRMAGRYAAAVAHRHEPVGPTRIVLMANGVENFAHHLWNSFPGFQRLVDLGLSDSVDEIRVAGSEFFGSLDGLFPEFARCRWVNEPAGARDPYPFSREHTLVLPGGYFITRRLLTRVVERMRCLPARRDLAQPTGSEPFPVVWIGLRVGSREWVDQGRELPPLIDEICARHPDALVLLDGYSYPVGRDLISTSWESNILRLHRLSAQITARVSQPDRVLDLVGNTLRESVLWASATDVYLAPVGTTQHKVGWLSEGAGIVYGPPSLAHLRPEEWPGLYQREGSSDVVTMTGTAVGAGERRRPRDRRPHLDNLILDRAALLHTLLDRVEAAGRRRSGGRTAPQPEGR